jgi:LPXTG-motif cell wall-anchored protein
MPVKKMVGLAALIVGVVLLIVGISATHSFTEKLTHGAVGEYSSSTMLLLIVGIVLIVAGAVVLLMGRKRR